MLPQNGENMTDTQTESLDLPAMLTAMQVGHLLKCSARTVRRLVDIGQIPKPVRLGGMVRWPRQIIEQWLADGCPSAFARRRRV
jgi:excisionase family DNA binding protein